MRLLLDVSQPTTLVKDFINAVETGNGAARSVPATVTSVYVLLTLGS
jgi:hypothetical protein